MASESVASTSNAMKVDDKETQPAPLTGRLASAASVAGPFQSAIAEAITKRRQGGKQTPKLIGILATPSPPSVAYAQWTKKACEQVGIEFEIWQTWASDDAEKGADAMDEEKADKTKNNLDFLEADVEDLIISANADDSINGIMVYYPIFGGRQDTYLQQIVDPRKDVEGLHFSYCFNMYHNIRYIAPSQLGGAPGTTNEAFVDSASGEERIPPGFAKSILPCTPLAVVKCLESLGVYDSSLPYGDRLFGKTITVINRSEVVGRPLAALLSNDGARVLSVDLDSIQEFNKRAEHDNSRKPSQNVLVARQRNASHRLRPHHVVRQCELSLQQCLAVSDVVISGVPAASFKVETSWVKEGAVTVNFSSEKNFEKDIRSRASIHLPAIGKTTIAMLQRNLLRLVEYREITESKAQDNSQSVNGSSSNGGNGPSSSSGGGSGGSKDGPNTGSDKGPPQPLADKGAQPSGQPNSNGGPNGTQRQGTDRAVEPEDGQSRPNSASDSLPAVPEWPRGNTASSVQPQPRHPHDQSGAPMTLPMRTASLSQASPPFPVRRFSQLGGAHHATSADTGAWEWRSPAARYDQTPPFSTLSVSSSRPGTSTSANTQAPQSPLLFAPIGSMSSAGHANGAVGNHMGPAQPGYGLSRSASGTHHSVHGNVYPHHANQSNASLHSISSPRSATPVSPLVIDGLSVEDNGSSNAAGLGSQRHSWDSGPPRTPNDVQDVSLLRPSSSSNRSTGNFSNMPSVLARPDREDADYLQAKQGYPEVKQQQEYARHPGQHIIGHPAGQQQDHHQLHHRRSFIIQSPVEEKMMLDHGSEPSPSVPPHMQAGEAYNYGNPTVMPGQQMGGQALTSQLPPANQSGRVYAQDRIAHSRRRRRPPFSYSSLIAQAIASAPDGRMTLREIYTWISNAYPDLYSMEGSEGSGWQNTVRHNLSLNKAFIKVARTAQDIYDSCSSGVASMSQQARGKGGWWMLDPNVNPATISAATKGDMDEDLDALRLPRRRRTNSTAASTMSEDDMTSPVSAGAPGGGIHGHPGSTPSVLQQQQQTRGRSYTTIGTTSEAGVPSVLRGARALSDERALSKEDEQHQQQQLRHEQDQERHRMHEQHDSAHGGAPVTAAAVGPVGARLIAGRTRPRGYTTNSTDLAMRGFAVPPPPLSHGPHPHPPHPHHQQQQRQQQHNAGGSDGVPFSPYGYASSLPSPGPYSQPLSPYSPSHSAYHLPGPAGPRYVNAAPPASAAARPMPTSNPPTPVQGGMAALPLLQSPQKRKLTFERSEPAATSLLHPAHYGRNAGASQLEDSDVDPRKNSPSFASIALPGGHPAVSQPQPLSRTALSARSPLSRRTTLAPPPSAAAQAAAGNGAKGVNSSVLRRQASMDDVRRVRTQQATSSIRGGATVEGDDANGSRMSITGLLNV